MPTALPVHLSFEQSINNRIVCTDSEWFDGHRGGDTPGLVRSQKLSPPAFPVLLWCASPREARNAVSLLTFHFFPM